MTISRTFTLPLVAIISLAATLMTAQEKKIKRSDLPAAVEKTVAAQSQGTKIRGFSEEKDQGQKKQERERERERVSGVGSRPLASRKTKER